jgi:hypothetical protein
VIADAGVAGLTIEVWHAPPPQGAWSFIDGRRGSRRTGPP